MLIKNPRWREIIIAVRDNLIGPLLLIVFSLVLFLFKKEPIFYYLGIGFILFGLAVLVASIIIFFDDMGRISLEYKKREKWLKRLKLYKEEGIKDSPFLSKVKEIIAAQLNTPPDRISSESKLKEDLGADSLDMVGIVMATEEGLGIEIPTELESILQTPLDIAVYIENQLAKTGNLKR